MEKKPKKLNRREFIIDLVRKLLVLLVGTFAFTSWFKSAKAGYVWQINPKKCVKCGRCATSCVINPSAVKCVHEFDTCGYCNLCFGYFQPGATQLTENAENQLCPTGALKRRFVEEPFFEYTINEPRCIGCGKCVQGCNLFGNGSLFLQVRHDLCKNCNECSIAKVCAGNAFVRVKAKKAYFKNV
jgi:H+/Na+-translocating ferredoxin:NAD+ oxidoreductase subunit B